MTKKRRPLLPAGLAMAALVAGLALAGELPGLSDAQREVNLKSFDYMWTTIRDTHYDPELLGLDWEAIGAELRPRVEAATTMNEARAPMDALIERLGQSHYNLIPQEAYEYLARPDNDFDGVTGIDARAIGGRGLVTKVLEGSPAAAAGVKPGWEILRVREAEVRPKLESLAEEFEGSSWKDGVLSSVLLSELRGPVGDSLPLSFLDGNDKTVELRVPLVEERGKKKQFGHLPPVHVWIEVDELEGNVGYLTFNAWLDPVSLMPVINDAMTKFMDAEGIVIDVRGNGGGLPGMVMGIAGWLVEEKNRYLGTMSTREVELKIVVNPRPRTYGGPVAILIDGNSGSASEMFSGGMQDIGRARIFGSRSAGAALPSTFERLPNGDGFQYAFGNYVSAGGQVLEGVGVPPDVEVLPTRKQLLEGRDPALEAAVAWILGGSTE